MPASPPEPSLRPRPTVFLSYASEDRAAAQRLRDALPGFGLEVWYDESDLVGGDAWDQKIRGQIRACDYFMPVISAHTEARHEGYFRREWRLAVERTLDMADDHVFLLPVVIDATAEAGARVPERFRAVQWLRLPDGQPGAALEALCRRLVSGETTPAPVRTAPEPPAGRAPRRRGAEFPPFPLEEPGQRVRFGFQVAGWGLTSAWIAFNRLPRWLRIVIYAWIAVALLARCNTGEHAAARAEKLKEIAATHPGGWTAADTARLIAQVANSVPAEAGAGLPRDAPVLAIPFSAPKQDAAAQSLAGSVFTGLYGRLAMTRHGRVALADEPLPDADAAAAGQQGRAHHARYIVWGGVGGGADPRLTVTIIAAADGSTLWSKSWPLAGADPARIAKQISTHVPRQPQG